VTLKRRVASPHGLHTGVPTDRIVAVPRARARMSHAVNPGSRKYMIGVSSIARELRRGADQAQEWTRWSVALPPTRSRYVRPD